MRIAITGGIADGKTTVCTMLAELGHPVVSADDIVHDLYDDPKIIEQIRADLGEKFVSDGKIDRDALRAAISDDALRSKVNTIFHPKVMAEIIERTETDALAFAEVPLLIETATQGLFDEVWVVVAGIDEQRRRLTDRFGSIEQADALLATQLPTEAKIPFATRVLRSSSLDQMRSQVIEELNSITER